MKHLLGFLAPVFILALSCQKKDVNTPTDFQLDKTIITFNNCSAKDSFTIKSAGNWTITIAPSNAAWLHLSKLSGNGTDKVLVTSIEDNQANTPRTATLTIQSSNTSIQPVNISVTQIPSISWIKLYGGSAFDFAQTMVATTDGGFLLAGQTESSDGDAIGNHGFIDAFLLKIDANGNKIWSKAFGGSDIDAAYSLITTPDGGIVMAGIAYSNNGDVNGNHGTQDFWVLKLDANGNKIWSKLYGGLLNEFLPTVIATSDGGFLIAGSTDSNDGDVSGNHGDFDAWLLKIDADGNKLWSKTFGGSGTDYANRMIPTNDGGFVIVGETTSNDGDVIGNHGGNDAWAFKVDANGNKVWSKTFGGSGIDQLVSIISTPDGSYVIAGNSTSNNADLNSNHGDKDSWILKLSANGDKIWSKAYGGSGWDEATSLVTTSNGELLVAGYTYSSDGDVSNNHGKGDAWILKLDGNGNKLCSKVFGGSDYDYTSSILTTADGGFVITGETRSTEGILTGNHGVSDVWVFKGNF